MYLSFYNLKTKPFQMSTDPDFLWLGEKHREALAVLKYAILENKGVLVLTGDVGTGKTTLIHALLKSLKEDTITATIYDPRLEVLDFFNTVAAAFEMGEVFESKGKFTLKFTEFLTRAHKQKKSVLLIIDEAQGINENLLEEIRLLSNLETEYTRLLNIFFVGQNEFIDILQKYEYRALRQRVSIRYHIDPLTLNETAAYITYRLKIAGTEAPIFDSGAIDEIYIFSDGYPRLINIMCDYALLSGYVREIQVIKADLIRECREELLVSKRTSGKDIEYFRDDLQSFQSDTIDNEPTADPFVPVEDSIHQASNQEVFSPAYPMSEPPRPPRPPKKRFYQSPLLMGFLLLIGVAGGFIFYNNGKNNAESLVALAEKQASKYVSAITKSENNTPPMDPVSPETPDRPNRIEAGKVGDSRYFVETSPNSTLLKETISKEPETSSIVSSKQSPQKNISETVTQNPGGPESDGSDNTTEVKPTGASDDSTEISPEEESPKEMASPKTTPAGSVTSNLGEKAPVVVPITEKTPDKIPTLASNPNQVHDRPNVPETVKKEASEPVERFETYRSTTQSEKV
ncbi:MAG: AAA family ATPase, partial [Deltaproteobacteria bacterium]|nr:AAA family ATPase [Deltaproteobacteria bacterium]